MKPSKRQRRLQAKIQAEQQVEKDVFDIFSGFFEVELTPDVIKKLVETEGIPEGDLNDLVKMGAKWNVNRKSFVFPTERSTGWGK